MTLTLSYEQLGIFKSRCKDLTSNPKRTLWEVTTPIGSLFSVIYSL